MPCAYELLIVDLGSSGRPLLRRLADDDSANAYRELELRRTVLAELKEVNYVI
jgi:hypothetical protein